MENVKIFIDGIQKDVYGLFYVFDSKYYFIYTEKEVDENGYVILYMSQVGKETKNTENGPVDTGYLIGIEISNSEEQQKVQQSISYIVEDKKNNTKNSLIQYLPINTLTNLKIVSKKRFRLLKSVIVDNFKLEVNDPEPSIINSSLGLNTGDAISPISPLPVVTQPAVLGDPVQNLSQQTQTTEQDIKDAESVANNVVTPINSLNNTDVILDYRSKYFEEEEKNKELQAKVQELTQKLNEIKKIIE